MRYYAFSSFTAIDYTTFIGTGTVEDPTGGQVFITSCQKNGLLNPGTPNALDTFEFTFNIDPLDNPLPCGITWVSGILVFSGTEWNGTTTIPSSPVHTHLNESMLFPFKKTCNFQCDLFRRTKIGLLRSVPFHSVPFHKIPIAGK